MGTKKIKGQYMNRSTFWMIKYMNGSVFSKARYMNGVGIEILARTSVPKLPITPHPRPPREMELPGKGQATIQSWNKEPKELLGGVFGDTEFWDSFL